MIFVDCMQVNTLSLEKVLCEQALAIGLSDLVILILILHSLSLCRCWPLAHCDVPLAGFGEVGHSTLVVRDESPYSD